MNNKIITVNNITLKSEYFYNKELLFKYKIEYPEFKSLFYHTALTNINLFYKAKAMEFKNYCEVNLFNLAIEQYKADIKNEFPVRVFDALLTYEMKYSESCIISLYFDKYEFTGGAHGITVRDAQTFNLQKGYMINLSQLVNCAPNYRTYLSEESVKQADLDPSVYFDDYGKLISKNFNRNNFYCTPQGIVLFFQQYDIAPYSSGIREFLIPYSDCVLDPQKLCYIANFKLENK